MRPAANAEPLDRDQLFVNRGVGSELEPDDDVHDDVGTEEQQGQLQPSAHQAIDGQRGNRERDRQRQNAEDEVPGVMKRIRATRCLF